MPEVLGVATICIEGRKRRHLGTICACKLICCNASAALLEPKLLATALALGLNTLEETRDYEVVISDLDCVLASQISKGIAKRGRISWQGTLAHRVCITMPLIVCTTLCL